MDAEGNQLGIMSVNAALQIAGDKGLDLVLFAQQATPPVCRIIDYGKFQFEQQKKEKEQKKNQKIVETKEIQLSCKIEENDIKTKANHAMRFLQGGDKVKVVVRFRGREMAHTNLGQQVLERFALMLDENGVIEKPPKLEGRNMVMFLASKISK